MRQAARKRTRFRRLPVHGDVATPGRLRFRASLQATLGLQLPLQAAEQAAHTGGEYLGRLAAGLVVQLGQTPFQRCDGLFRLAELVLDTCPG